MSETKLMPIAHGGVAKLIEECGELQQVLGKFLSYGWGIEHPDGKGDLARRTEDEMADVIAAISLVMLKHRNLDQSRVNFRAEKKLALFLEWDKRE